MSTTDQPQEPAPVRAAGAQSFPTQPTVPLPPAATAPGYPPGPPAAPPVPPRPAESSSRVWIIVGSIIAGILLLGFAFGAGGVIGFVVGAHHAERVVSQQLWFGPGGQGPGREGPGRSQQGPQHGPMWQDRHGNDKNQDDSPTPSPSPTP